MFYSIGSDMENFAVDKKGNHVALCGLIGGTKEEPLQIAELKDGYMIQEDNVALEFNIPVCYTAKEFVQSFKIMRSHTTKILKSLGFKPSNFASVSFDKKQLTHPKALEFGCEPDFSAWTCNVNPRPTSKNETLRTCGGHIHVGSSLDMTTGVRNMDLLLGVPSIIADDNPASVTRRELYGKAGAMRPKNYGWEYRVLSNFWMFSDSLVRWVFDQTFVAATGGIRIDKPDEDKIQDCINNSNKDLALELCNKYNIYIPA